MGFYGASLEVDPDSLVTPWLISLWLVLVFMGFRRAHGELRRFFNLDKIGSSNLDEIRSSDCWQEVGAYFSAFGLGSKAEWYLVLMDLLYRYSRATGQFLFGVASQYRRPHRL